jgi:hypothetical protein
VFKKAEKSKSLLRAAIFGPSGSGKTFTALSIATGMAEILKSRIAFVDTERGSASKYADRFDFDVVDLLDPKIENYTQMFKDAEAAGYKVLVIDSLSHGWQQLLDEIETLAKAKYGGNSFRAWGEGTPKQRDFIDALLAFNGHVIGTMRSKMDYLITQDERGKQKIQRVGLAPEQGKGIEYEFDLLLELNPEHFANVLKDRTGRFQDKLIEKPGVDFGKQLIAWLNEGTAEAKILVNHEPEKKALLDKCKVLQITFTDAQKADMKGKTIEQQIVFLKETIAAKEATK